MKGKQIFQRVEKSPQNNSRSKIVYSFSQGKRFKDTKNIDLPYYDLPNVKSPRTTSMGVGNRIIFKDTKKSPSPTNYLIKSQFECQKKYGFSFGLGRKQIKSNSIFKTSKIPGPGSYNPELNKSNRSVSLKTLARRPGQYQTNTSTLYGKMTNSKYNTIRSTAFRKPQQYHKQFKLSQQPAPWTYKFVVLTRKGQKSIQGGKSYRFSRSPRNSQQRIQTQNPGPGQYQVFSPFIHY